MAFSMYLLFVAAFTRPVVAKQPDFFVGSEDQPPPPMTMNADFFEDPNSGVPLAPAPADAQEPQDLPVHLDSLPASPAPAMDAPMMEVMPPATAPEDSDEETSDSENQQPSWSDYAEQQNVNAELAERVAKLTKATHLLLHEERTLRRRSHQQILKMKQKCQLKRHKVRVSMNIDEEQSARKNLRQKSVLPVSLTHHQTKHHRINRLNSEVLDTADGPLIGSAVGSMAGMYVVEGGDDHQDASEEETAKRRQLEDELQTSRVRLGRNEEARLHLEDQIRDLEGKYQQQMRDAAQRKQDIAAAEQRQRAKELELKSVKQQSTALRNDEQTRSDSEQARIEQEKKDLLTYRDQQDVKLRAKKNEVHNLQAKNTELRNQLQATLDNEKTEEDQLKSYQDTWARLSGQVEALHRDEVEVSQEQQTEEQRLLQENDKLKSEAEEERQCMDWGHSLEGRLQHELQRKVADAKLCRDSIMSLHNERQELKSKSSKYKKEIQEAKTQESEARRSYEENQQLLDHCLGQMSR